MNGLGDNMRTAQNPSGWSPKSAFDICCLFCPEVDGRRPITAPADQRICELLPEMHATMIGIPAQRILETPARMKAILDFCDGLHGQHEIREEGNVICHALCSKADLHVQFQKNVLLSLAITVVPPTPPTPCDGSSKHDEMPKFSGATLVLSLLQQTR